jgi:hypothetical protein
MALGPAVPIGFWIIYDWALEHNDMSPADILDRLERPRGGRRGPPRRSRGSTRKGMVRATARRAYEPKKKRKVSAYQKEFGRQLKKLKRAHPRTPVTRLMKRAHAATRRARR